ncbi:hypothetical protein HNY73_019764 [Argiope bruennichi]|uniref:Uncharacterized protein n=1 Tax=Argiope bruennichi TaxID=94029 RepID=A0A8T0E5W5_ARGBR|nr:hypothetical protein HNY73_019764 [Argiope bruennichi]
MMQDQREDEEEEVSETESQSKGNAGQAAWNEGTRDGQKGTGEGKQEGTEAAGGRKLRNVKPSCTGREARQERVATREVAQGDHAVGRGRQEQAAQPHATPGSNRPSPGSRSFAIQMAR